MSTPCRRLRGLIWPIALLAVAGAAFGADGAAGPAAKAAQLPLTITLDPGMQGGAVSDALRIVMLLTLLAVIQAILIDMTSFTRTIIVLSMLRRAFSMRDTPPNMVLVSLALF
jgi:flagellar biosynthetic protein FliP